MPNFLTMDMNDGSGQCAAYTYANATPTKLGDSFGVAYTLEANNQTPSMVVQFDGEIYAMAQDGIYQKDDPSVEAGAWTQQIAFVNAGSLNVVGLFAIGTGLVGIHPVTTDGRHRWVKFDGTTWTQAPADAITMSNNPRVSSVVVYHDVIFWIGAQTGGSSGRAFSFDPATDTFVNLTSVYTAVYGSGGNASLCVFDDRLLVIGDYDSGGSRTCRLSEWNGSAFISLQTFDVHTNSIGTSGKWELFTDGTNMWAFTAHDSGGTGWRCSEWDLALTRTEKTVDVLPPSLRWTGAAGGTWSGNIGIARWAVIYDLNSVIGVTDIYLYHSSNGSNGTGLAAYKWNGNNMLMTQVDSGGNAADALPHSQLHFGEHIFTAGELDPVILGRLGVIGGEEITFRLRGGGSGRKFKMHHLLRGTPPLLDCTFALPVTGGSATLNVGAKQVEGLDADGTNYTVVWNVSADGRSPDDRVIRAPEALA